MITFGAWLLVARPGHARAQSPEAPTLEPQFQALLGRPGGLTAEQAARRTEVGEAENALVRARFEAVDARIELWIARVRLTHAAGRDSTR